MLRANSTVDSPGLTNKFQILNKSQEKLDYLTREMLFIRERKPKLTMQSHSIRKKVIKRTPPHSLERLTDTLADCHHSIYFKFNITSSYFLLEWSQAPFFRYFVCLTVFRTVFFSVNVLPKALHSKFSESFGLL